MCKVVQELFASMCEEDINFDIVRFFVIKVSLGYQKIVSFESLIMNQMRVSVPDS